MIDERRVNGRRSVVMENAVAQLVVDVLGGSFVDFHLRDQNLNPLVWNNGGDPDTPSQMSHFLCLDRWGFPSDAEAAHGMPYHGEAALVEWRVAPPTAGQTIGKSFACFLARIPTDYGGVSGIRYDAGSLTVLERGHSSRTLTCACPRLEA